MSLRLAFFGTAEFAVPSLRALKEAGHALALVVCQPDRPKGRGHQLQPPPLKRAALDLGLDVLQPESVREASAWRLVRDADVDLACVVAYGQMLPQEVLDAPRLGCVNVHASLLPRWRGAAPIEWALANGDPETGVSVQRMVRRMDAGDVLLSERRALGPGDDAPGLHAELAGRGAGLLLRAVDGLASGALRGAPQPESEATYAPLLKKSDGYMDFSGTRADLLNRFRAFKERPGVRVFLGALEPSRLAGLSDAGARAGADAAPAGSVLELSGRGMRVACGDGALWLERLVPPSGREMGAAEYGRGLGLSVGGVLPRPPAA